MINKKYLLFALIISFGLVFFASCTRDVDVLEPAEFPKTPEVFIDGFSSGLFYAAFGGSKVTAFDVDTEVKYSGTASMKFEVPDFEDPEGAYAGGAYVSEFGRDLSGYDALTFWIKASKAASIDVLGFGNDLGELKFVTTLLGTKVNTNWQKIIIPIPDPSMLKAEKGMFYYSEGNEDGSGYTFWIDEVKFEKLGTIAHPKPAILEEQDQSASAEIGEQLTIGGTFSNFNLPNGTYERVEVAPAYFNFNSSDSMLAKVDEFGVVTVLDSGTVVITAELQDVTAKGSLTIGAVGALPSPSIAAQTPTVSPDSVISLFSNAYTNVKVDTWNPFWEYSTAEVKDVQIAGDDVKLYKKLNFVGIEFTSETIDASDMNYFHLDIWTPDPAEAAEFEAKLVDFGADNEYGGDNDSEVGIKVTSPTLVSESWIGVDIPLAGLANKANVAQLILVGNENLNNVYIDNLYFYNDGNGGDGGNPITPTSPASTPSEDAANVTSIFSDAYTNLDGTNLNPDWGQATATSEVSISGNNTLRMMGLDYQGIELAGSQDVSSMENLHIDVYTANSTALNVYLISTGPIEAPYAVSVPTSGWSSIDIPLSSFSPVDLADLIQFKFEGNGDIFIDNIYFYKSGGGGNPITPTSPASTPSEDATNVTSIFSDAYTNLDGTNLNPDWGQATATSEVSISGNNTLQMMGLDYQGIELAGSQDVSSMENLHIDVYTANSTALNVYLISTGPIEAPYAVSVPTSGWSSIDIPLSSFSPVDLADLIQFKFEGNGDIFIDNIYFYKSGGGGNSTVPTVAAPTPTQNSADVISLFSDAYNDVTVDSWRTDWSSAVLEDVTIAGNAAKKYSALDFVGIVTEASTIDATGMTHVHLDIWSADFTLFGIKIVDFGANGVYDGGGDDVEHQYDVSTPNQSEWVSLDIPLSDFTNLTTKGHLAQYILVGQPTGATTVYIDNFYFHK